MTKWAWWSEPLNLWLLINWMRTKPEHLSMVQDVEDVLSVIEKPWHFNQEFEQMQAEMREAGVAA